MPFTLELQKKKDFMLKNIRFASREDLLFIGRQILLGAKLQECAEGTLVNLEDISDEKLNDLWLFVTYLKARREL